MVRLRFKQPLPSNPDIWITFWPDAKQHGIVGDMVDAVNPKVPFASQAVQAQAGLIHGRFDEVECSLPDGHWVWAENPLVLLRRAYTFYKHSNHIRALLPAAIFRMQHTMDDYLEHKTGCR